MANTFELPSNVEAERTVLGCMLIDNNICSTVIALLKNDDAFSNVDPRNKLVFNAICQVRDSGDIVDVTTVGNQLINTKLLEAAGGSDYLFELVKSQVNLENAEHYVKIVKDQAVLRRFLLKMEEVKQNYVTGNFNDIGDFLSNSNNDLTTIANQRSVGGFQTAEDVVDIVREQMKQESKRTDKHLTGVDTGYQILNKMTHGWQPGSLNIIAARPSVGKTALAINLLYNAAKYMEAPVAFFSGEMPNSQIMKRMLAAQSTVELEKIQTGEIYANDETKLVAAFSDIQGKQIFFDDTPNPEIGDICAKSRKLKSQHPDLCCVFVDYLNIISTTTNIDSKAQEIGFITKTLKELARVLEIPVVCLAQLNRNVINNDGVPSLSNLKDSGSIEQDADTVLLLYREDYDNNKKMAKDNAQPSDRSFVRQVKDSVEQSINEGKDYGNTSVVQIYVAKNRNGKTGEVVLLFSKNFQRFDAPSLDWERSKAEIENKQFNNMPQIS